MQRKIEYKLGTISDVLNGGGIQVENPNEVYKIPDKPRAIYIPRIVGVYQTDPFIQIEELEQQIRNMGPEIDLEEVRTSTEEALLGVENELIRRLLVGPLRDDTLPPKLISLLFDGSASRKEEIEQYTLNRNPYSRVTIFEGFSAPNFRQKKPRKTSQLNGIALNALKSGELDRYRPMIGKHIEEMDLDMENYGLTLMELNNLFWIKNLAAIRLN